MRFISKVEDVMEIVLKRIVGIRDETKGGLMSKIVSFLCKMKL